MTGRECTTCPPGGPYIRWCEGCQAASDVRVAELLAQPAVAAILDRAGRLTGNERVRLHAAWLEHFRVYRTEQSSLGHRWKKVYGEYWRDVLQAKYTIGKAVVDPEPSWGAPHAAEDAAEAVILADAGLLSEDEVFVFARPWRAVIGTPPVVD